MARHPVLGQGKTRLASTIGAEATLAVYHELLAHAGAAVVGVAATKTVWLAGAPTPDVPDCWPGYTQHPQPSGDLGQRMHTAFAAAFETGAAKAIIIGTDCPELTTDLLTKAFAQLDTHDVVLGPALDGGYYLLGMKQLILDFFLQKAWSTASVRPATLADAARLGLRVALLPPLADVDTAEDLAAWRTRTAPVSQQL